MNLTSLITEELQTFKLGTYPLRLRQDGKCWNDEGERSTLNDWEPVGIQCHG